MPRGPTRREKSSCQTGKGRFGISTPDQARMVAEVADGVVVGSALINALDGGGVAEATGFLLSLRKGMDGGL